MNERSGDNRFWFESLCVVLLVLAWVVACVGVFGSHRWRRPFASGPVLVDLDSKIRGPVTRSPEGWRIEASPDLRRSIRIAPVEMAAGVDHLLEVRARSGPGVRVDLGRPGDSRRLARSWIPPRGQDGTSWVLLPAVQESERLQLRLFPTSSLVLEITGLEVRALSPVHRRVPVLLVVLGPLVLLGFGTRHRRRLRAFFAPGEGEDPQLDALLGGLLILALVLIFHQAPVNQTMDAKYLSAVSHSLLTRGTLALPPDLGPVLREPQPYQLVTLEGRTFHFFSTAPAILNAPIVFAFERAGISSVAPDGRFLRQQEVRIFRVAAAVAAAALCGVLFWLARIWLRPGAALGLTLIFAFGTQILSTMSRPFWSHSWASLLLAAALYPLLAPRFADRRWAYVIGATLLSWSFFCRPSMALAALGVSGLVIATRRRFVWPLAITGAVWLGLFMVHSYIERGEWLPGYFFASHITSGRLLSSPARSSYLEGMLGTLVSPSRGLLIYVPITLGILFVVGRYWRQLPSRPVAVTALAVLLAQWQLISNFANWWGGRCFGARLFSDIVVWLFLLAVLGATALGAGKEGGRSPRRPLLTAFLLLMVVASVFVNTRGAIAPETLRSKHAPRWQDPSNADEEALFSHPELWDWRHPQFLAGL